MKCALIALAVLCAASLAACAALPSKSDITAAVTAPGVDSAAVRFEHAVAALVIGLDAATQAPGSGVNPAKLAKAAAEAHDALVEARTIFDARSGDPSGLVNRAFDALDEAVPATASAKVRFALALGRGAGSAFAGSALPVGPPTPPSPELIAAREATDLAVKALVDRRGPS